MVVVVEAVLVVVVAVIVVVSMLVIIDVKVLCNTHHCLKSFTYYFRKKTMWKMRRYVLDEQSESYIISL